MQIVDLAVADIEGLARRVATRVFWLCTAVPVKTATCSNVWKCWACHSLAAARASRLAMCKSASKERFFQVGVPTQPYVLVHEADTAADIAGKTATLRFPLVVKPDSQGSSLGLGLARNGDELQAAARAALALEPFALVEPHISGREFTVAILGRQPLPLLEIISPGGLFDYEAKYESAMTDYRFDTGLMPDTAAEIEHTAVAAAEARARRALCASI